MGLIQFGGGVVQISGSIGGTTHARNRFGNYIRPRTKPIDPRAPRQMAARLLIIALAEQWREDPMDDTIRGVWETYAKSVAMKNRLGQEIHLSGFNHFIRSNASRIAAGLDMVTAGPPDLGLPNADDDFSVAGSAESQELTITFDNTLTWANEIGGALSVDLCRPQNPTRNFLGGPFRNAGAIEGDETTPPETGAVLTAPFSLVEGQKTVCEARVIRADGRVSTRFRCDPFVSGA